MRRSSPQEGRGRAAVFHRLDDAAAWINPVLMIVAAILLIVDLSCFTASKMSQMGGGTVGRSAAVGRGLSAIERPHAGSAGQGEKAP